MYQWFGFWWLHDDDDEDSDDDLPVGIELTRDFTLLVKGEEAIIEAKNGVSP